MVVRLRAGRRRRARRLRRDRERRPRRVRRRAGRAEGVRAVLPGQGRRPGAGRTSIDRRRSIRRPAVRRPRARDVSRSAASCAGSTGSCSPSARSSATGSGRSRASRASTSRATPTTTSPVRRSPPGSGSPACSSRSRSIPPVYRAPLAGDLRGHDRGSCCSCSSFAEAVRGSKRWIDLGPFQFQPSEFGKLFFVLAIAGFLAERATRLRRSETVADRDRPRRPSRSLLVFVQPDLGTALVYGAALTAVLFVAGVRWLHLRGRRRWRALAARERPLVPAGRGRPGAEAVPDRPPGRLPAPATATPGARPTT